jgi:hypothetical protein
LAKDKKPLRTHKSLPLKIYRELEILEMNYQYEQNTYRAERAAAST